MSESPADQASADATPDRSLHTALHEGHLTSGARLADFARWHMPIRYSGIIEEHHAVRKAAGLFDLSHMGELWVTGPGAARGLSAALVSDPTRLRIGRAQYSLVCTPDGGIIDDLIVYRTEESTFLVVPNAANTAAARSAIVDRLAGHDAVLDDATMRTSLLAIQGPQAVQILAPLTDIDIAELRYYSAARGMVAGSPVLVARTGYTGEDGFELYLDWDAGPPVWDALIEAGSGRGLQPCGLGARDTLRLEAGMPLYGNELDLETTPYEAGLGRVVKLDKEADFTGRDSLAALAQRSPARSLVGLRLRGRGIARHGYPVHRPGEAAAIGIITSGSHSPTQGEAIAMAYVPPSDASPGTMLEIAIRGSAIPAEVVALPFYKRAPAATAGGS